MSDGGIRANIEEESGQGTKQEVQIQNDLSYMRSKEAWDGYNKWPKAMMLESGQQD